MLPLGQQAPACAPPGSSAETPLPSLASPAPACAPCPSLDPPAQTIPPPPGAPPALVSCFLASLGHHRPLAAGRLGSLPTTLWPPCPQERRSPHLVASVLPWCPQEPTTPALLSPPLASSPTCPGSSDRTGPQGTCLFPMCPHPPSWFVGLLPGASLEPSFSLTCPASDETWWGSGSETPLQALPSVGIPGEPRSVAPAHSALGCRRSLKHRSDRLRRLLKNMEEPPTAYRPCYTPE